VVGFKPTFDRVSREGCFPLGLTLDHIGPMTRTVAELQQVGPAFGLALETGPVSLKGVRIGLPANFFFERIDGRVETAVRRAAKAAEAAGAVVTEVRVGDGAALNTMGRVIQLAEAAAVLERYAHRRKDFGADVLALLDQGRMIPATEYLNAQRVRRVLVDEFARVWQHCDVLLTPATPMPAPKIGEAMVEIGGEMEDVRIAGTRLTRPINVLGWPAVAMPCGRTTEGLPLGMQLIGPWGKDESLVGWAARLEELV
jgi:aspartyl-tRNA(Asn)/glutamyl-tRNA(Gln) amidotransferase subunit A